MLEKSYQEEFWSLLLCILQRILTIQSLLMLSLFKVFLQVHLRSSNISDLWRSLSEYLKFLNSNPPLFQFQWSLERLSFQFFKLLQDRITLPPPLTPLLYPSLNLSLLQEFFKFQNLVSQEHQRVTHLPLLPQPDQYFFCTLQSVLLPLLVFLLSFPLF